MNKHLSIFAIALIVGIMFYLNETNSELIKQPSDLQHKKTEGGASSDTYEDLSGVDKNTTHRKEPPFQEQESKTNLPTRTYEQIIEQNEWLQKHGFKYIFNPVDGTVINDRDNSSDYYDYDITSLIEMATNNPRAALEAGDRLFADKQYDEAIPYLENAAVHGYANSLLNLSLLYTQKAKVAQKMDSGAEALEEYIEAVAWGHVLKLRFYPDKEEVEVLDSVKKYDETIIKEIKKISLSRSKEIYSNLKLKRVQSNLGEFDNEIPQSFINQR